MLDFSFVVESQLMNAKSRLEEHEDEYQIVSRRLKWWDIVRQVWEDCVRSNDTIIILEEVLQSVKKSLTDVHIHRENIKLGKECRDRVQSILESLCYTDIRIEAQESDVDVYFSIRGAKERVDNTITTWSPPLHSSSNTHSLF